MRYRRIAVTTDAVSVWKLDERSGTSALDSEGGSPGTLEGSPARVEGRFGRALELDGTDDRVRVPDAASLKPSTALTLETWVYPMALGVQRTLLAKGVPGTSGYQLYLDTSGRIAFNFRVTGGRQQGTSTTALALNRWQHVAVTFDSTRPSGQSRLYIDGLQVTQTATLANAGTLVHGATEVTFGEGSGGSRFRGRIDEVGLWSRALTDAEVLLHGTGGLYGDRLGDACDACPFDADPECAPLTCDDDDGDGYGPQGASSCYGHFALFDCDDEDAGIHPAAVEVCDGVEADGLVARAVAGVARTLRGLDLDLVLQTGRVELCLNGEPH